MTSRWSARSGDPSDSGASAVEFALLMPVLLLLIFGIIDYGMLFNDSISLRQGAREGARQAVVAQYPPACSTGAVGDRIACTTKAATELTLGTPVVRVLAPSGFTQAKQLLVCVQSKEKSLTGFVPFPSAGIIRTKTYMSIEATSADPTYTTDAAPAGGDWASWCTS